MHFQYKTKLEEMPEGGFFASFEDIPEAMASGKTKKEALYEAAKALEAALLSRVKAGETLPLVSQTNGITVTPSAQSIVKLAVLVAFDEANITKTKLANRLDVNESEARRILDPLHATKLPTLERTLEALGKRLSITIEEVV